MKIGIDIDGVILDYERVLKTYGELYSYIELNKRDLINPNEQYLTDRYNWTEEECENFIDKYFVKLSKKAELIPGAKDVIKMLQKEGNQFIIITARGYEREEMKIAAEEKLKEEGLKFDKYYWRENDKVEIAKKENIDLMIDDTYQICKKMAENKIKTLYFRDKKMKKIEEGKYLKDVSNWGEIYKYVMEENK